MDKKIKIIQLKILLVILEIMLVLLIWTLVQVVLLKHDDVAERFFAPSEPVEEVMLPVEPIGSTTVAEPSPPPFVLTNFDKIRVVITNKETGGIYHESAEGWQEQRDYRGIIEVIEEEQGFVIINELPIEEYLYSVVPSEMPAGYPMEALKAQAICARTYAYLHVLSPGYPQWNAHVDDTTSYQVYHNIEEQESTTRAVNETEGIVLLAPGEQALAQTYYYSTSCGYGSDALIWKSKYADSYPYIQSKHISRLIDTDNSVVVSGQTIADTEKQPEHVEITNSEVEVYSSKALTEAEFVAYIKTVNEEDFEAKEGWYRWNYRVEDLDVAYMQEVLRKRYEAKPELILTKVGDDYISQPIGEFHTITYMEIGKRGAGGVAEELLIHTDKAVYKVITELNIRYVLNDGCSPVKRQDGTTVERNSLLPSAFIVLEVIREDDFIIGYEIYGGGFGHGAGMSQNAAKVMAQEGMNAEEILTFFFTDCIVKDRSDGAEREG